MRKITNTTELVFTEITNGARTGITFTNTVEGYINAIHGEGGYSDLDQYIIEVIDEDGELDFYDSFPDLSLEDQLEACIRANNEACASRTTWKIARS